MAWFLAMQGTPTKLGQSLVYELQESADRQRIAEEMSSAATLDRVVPVPAVFGAQRQEVTIYVRPAAWGVWAFYELSEEERRQMMAANPLVTALAQAAKQQQGGRAQGQPPLR
ncbi:hypothetical protein E4P42_11805 [Mycobacterium sp. PS03-16]|uniref:LPXTG cell wall anchor domain-containing protein n=1 Tax=Mycobacterium sp. PS03-16 TaxID=2559611 RepID=UPI001073A7A8|nr:LPXTG cell wall anchor domain-containing protein [Mycobacterium sp. PS03-16]TFV58389.1 hypothetical protein E4P42_11805 [Mycobacterium sp. PS03-16]